MNKLARLRNEKAARLGGGGGRGSAELPHSQTQCSHGGFGKDSHANIDASHLHGMIFFRKQLQTCISLCISFFHHMSVFLSFFVSIYLSLNLYFFHVFPLLFQ